MFHSRLHSFSRLVISLTLALCSPCRRADRRSPAAPKAQDKRQNAPGEFDFYVLSLSWSPSFCEEAAERGRAADARKSSAADGPTLSWCTGCGRNMRTAFRNIASGRRRG